MYQGKYFYYEELLRDMFKLDIVKTNNTINDICSIINGVDKLNKLSKSKSDYNDLLNYIESTKNKLIMYSRIKIFILGLSIIERSIIELRYIENMDWINIEEKIGYSHTHTFRIKNNIFKKLKEYLEKDDAL